MNGRMVWLAGGMAVVLLIAAISPPVRAGDYGDQTLVAARKFVESSDRYLHHDKLQRGMKGYGLTVLSGTEVVRFDAEIVSVLSNWGPHQDVILAKLSAQGMEKTGIIAGMSGSPVFIKDPSDGKDKMIGAVAYGWLSQKEPLCGIQPITQMLAVSGVVPKAAKDADGAKTEAPTTRPGAAAPSAGKAPEASPEYLSAILNPRKVDFTTFGWPKRLLEPAATGGAGRWDSPDATSRLEPLATPLLISGGGPRMLSDVARFLEPLGMIPVQAGGVGAADAQAARNARLVPGAGISVPLARGDADVSAVGTVTEVVGDRVLAFGHPMFNEGESDLPMGPAYIHTVVSGLVRSVKIGSTVGIAGTLDHDEGSAISGRLGPKAAMIPMTVNVEWTQTGRKQTFQYEVCRHRRLTPLMTRTLAVDAVTGWRALPEHHVIRHQVRMDYGKLGRFQTEDISSDADVMPIVSDITRPVSAMLTNPLGTPLYPDSITVNVTVDSGVKTAAIQELRLDGTIFRPGDTVAGAVTVRPFRQERTTIPIRFKLPDDLPDGRYTLSACDSVVAMAAQALENPQRFNPRTTEQLFESVRRATEGKADHVYLRLPLGQGGVSLGQRELPDLPDSKAHVLVEAGKLDTFRFSRTLEEAVKTDYVLTGSAAASFEVQKNTNQTILRDQRDQK